MDINNKNKKNVEMSFRKLKTLTSPKISLSMLHTTYSCKGMPMSTNNRLDWSYVNFGKLINVIPIFTNVFKMNETVGTGIYSESLCIKRSIQLPNLNRAFQAEVSVIQAAENIRGRTLPFGAIFLFFDSQEECPSSKVQKRAVSAWTCNAL